MFSSSQNEVHFQDNALLKLRSTCRGDILFSKTMTRGSGKMQFAQIWLMHSRMNNAHFQLFQAMHASKFRKIPFISKHLNWSVFSRKHGYPRGFQSTSFFVCFLSLCRGLKFYSQQSCTEVWRQLWPEQAGNVWKLRRDINGRMAYSNHANFQHIYIKS